MKKIAAFMTFSDEVVVTVKVYDNRREWNEYVARLFYDDTEDKDSSYHTDDREDAIDTAKSMLMSATFNHTVGKHHE